MQSRQQEIDRPRSWDSVHQRAAKASCGLIRRPSQREQKRSSAPAAPPSQQTMTSHHLLQPSTPPAADHQQQQQRPSHPTSPIPQKQSTASPLKRRASLRERFWTVSSANAFSEEDRERRVRQHQEKQHQQHQRASYVPRHAATDFSAQMNRTSRHGGGGPYLPRHSEDDLDDGEEGPDDYALFVERSQMLHQAEEEAAAAKGLLLPGRTKSQKRRSFGRRIAEYVKPPREER